MASAVKTSAGWLKGREAPFVAAVADFFHAVDNAPRAKANAAIGTNEFSPAGNRIHVHVRSFRFPRLFRLYRGGKFHRLHPLGNGVPTERIRFSPELRCAKPASRRTWIN